MRDFAVYGRPLRRMNDHVRHPDQKGYVWEWVATRPSFCSNLNDRPYMTPTVKKEIHVWRRNSDAVVTDVEVVGTFYVQVKQDASTRHHRHPTAHPRRTHPRARGRARIRAKSSSGTRAKADKLT